MNSSATTFATLYMTKEANLERFTQVVERETRFSNGKRLLFYFGGVFENV
jgi:hypothetical protein